ncbi:hypothetical protein [Streptomyces niveus]|uniref:hypothetical protein n=1 Tax=Streptomyces niveus TaxID=193462 RepID=UPI0035DE00E4
MNRPLLFLDVDGPLNPYAAKPERRPDGYTTLRVPWNRGTSDEPRGLSSRLRPLRVRLNPDHGRALLRLGYELCWATTWMDEANRWIGPVLGLPELPFAWVDDEQSVLDERYVATHHSGPGLLHHVDPRIGLREDDFRTLARFARSLTDPAS